MPDISVPQPVKQLAMHQLLLAARKTMLHDALSEALGSVDPNIVQEEIKRYAPAEARQLLAKVGIRDEHVFATPAVLRAQPSTLGYYRLLLGIPKKQFYRPPETGLTKFESMEVKEQLKATAEPFLGELCTSLNRSMAELVLQLDPEITAQDVAQLPLLTLGVQYDGKLRNDIGAAAVAELFVVIRELVEPYLASETDTSLTLVNSSDRKVRIVLASDPDVRIFEQFGETEDLKVAIEVKGGGDASNAHNRAGEAEKSHQKVKAKARDFWTVIALKRVDLSQLQVESPTTREWFNVAEVLARTGSDYEKFMQRLEGAVGVNILAKGS